jgi:RNA polymerase sigma factor (sigma-70 family)
MHSFSDANLLAKVLEKNQQAWTELMRRYRQVMLNVIYKCGISNEEDVEDVFSEACLNLIANDMRKLKAYRASKGCSLSSWMGLIAKRTTSDFYRLKRAKRRGAGYVKASMPEIASSGPGPLDELLADEQRQILQTALRRLSPVDRRFARLYCDEVHSDEIAIEMGIEIRTVYTRYHKLRKKLESRFSSGEHR